MHEKSLKNSEIAAVILSGGLSTRMGKDKARLCPYGVAKPDLLARTHALLSIYFNKIWVSCAKDNIRDNYDYLIDAQHQIGPISGIYAGLYAAQKANFKAMLILPCDLPLIDESIIQHLLMAYNTNKQALMTTFRHEDTQFIEALSAIYSVNALNYFEKAIKDNIRAPRLVIPENLRTHINCTKKMKERLFNLNTTREYEDFTKKYA